MVEGEFAVGELIVWVLYYYSGFLSSFVLLIILNNVFFFFLRCSGLVRCYRLDWIGLGSLIPSVDRSCIVCSIPHPPPFKERLLVFI